jgi:hypothetical protein
MCSTWNNTINVVLFKECNTENLSSYINIKFYLPFHLGVRSKECNFLQKTAYFQSLSISLAPTIPVVSAIVTFLAHISAGNNLTAAQVLHNTCMKCNLVICVVF